MVNHYFYTIRYLKPQQIFWRVLYKLYTPKPDLTAAPLLRELANNWQPSIKKISAKISVTQYHFLNQEHDITAATIWNDPKIDKLWLYNLHYFTTYDPELIERWLQENPPGKGIGWEPYPISLRIVNWIKHALSGNKLSTLAIQSLAIQARFLSKKIEYHILANHLFANAKALVFAGCFFKGKEAEHWFKSGMRILNQEIKEQILADGAHFELSPMYHSIILEDILDLINVMQTYGKSIPEEWYAVISRMFAWLAKMTHPNGELAFFNDTALAIASTIDELSAYAQAIHIVPTSHYMHKQDNHSGYWRLQKGKFTVIIDAAAIGPDYQPGHAHADSLSFELSSDQQRVLVNSGIACYGLSQARLQQRGTAAHNTLVVDDENSSEVWSGFRVARRAQIFAAECIEMENEITLRASHNGYARLHGKPRHRREFKLQANKLLITDTVAGSGEHNIKIYFHVHPEFTVQQKDQVVEFVDKDKKTIMTGIFSAKVAVKLIDTCYHPEFGKSIPNKTIVLETNATLPIELQSTFE